MAYKTLIQYIPSKTTCYITDTADLYVNDIQKATLFSSMAHAKRILRENKIPLKDVEFHKEDIYFSELRHSFIKDIKQIVTEKGGNQLTLLCLIATMTDKKLKEFHTEILLQKNKSDEKL